MRGVHVRACECVCAVACIGHMRLSVLFPSPFSFSFFYFILFFFGGGGRGVVCLSLFHWMGARARVRLSAWLFPISTTTATCAISEGIVGCGDPGGPSASEAMGTL